ncbi:MAG: LytTR family transcriptional regulator [Acidobacteria bacterium]|nr:LytTR family transcriptional regulator [Acidobacteriota bacterium]
MRALIADPQLDHRLRLLDVFHRLPQISVLVSVTSLEEMACWLEKGQVDAVVISGNWDLSQIYSLLVRADCLDKTLAIGMDRPLPGLFACLPGWDEQEVLRLLACKLNEPSDPSEFQRRIWCRKGNRYQMIHLQDVVLFSKDNRYTALNLFDGSAYLSEKSLAEWEEGLCEKLFFRVNRCAIVNRQHISEFEPGENGNLSLVLISGLSLSISRNRVVAFLAWYQNTASTVAVPLNVH